MSDQSVTKVDSTHSPVGPDGEKYLVTGKRLAMRLWEEAAGEESAPHTRPYETVGYVVSGRVEVHVGDSVVVCGAGDSYLVPDGAEHYYRVLEDLTAVETTAPPAHLHGRDEEG